MALRKGTVVTIVKRPLGYECAQVQGHRLKDCLYTDNVSGITTTTHEPVFEPWEPGHWRPRSGTSPDPPAGDDDDGQSGPDGLRPETGTHRSSSGKAKAACYESIRDPGAGPWPL
jgi:hypothetical protein